MAALGSCTTVRIKPWSPAQGEFVEINESDFDPKKHELFASVSGVPVTPPPTVIPPPPVVPKVPHPALANLPKNWRDRQTTWLREFVEKMSGRTPETREQAIQMIEAIL